MKYLLIALVLIIGCGENPSSNEDYVDVYLKMVKSGYTAKIYSNNQLVSIISKVNEADTISVICGAVLKAKIYSNGKYTHKLETAIDGLNWVLP